MLGIFTGGGTYQEAKFEADADLIMEYYRNEGYVRARVGQPELKVLEDSKDGKTRWIQLRIPVTEGQRYRVGEFAIDGNTVVKSRGAAAALQGEGRRLVQREGHRATACARRRRSTAAAATWSSPASRT